MKQKWPGKVAIGALSCSLAAGSWLTFGGNPQRNGWAKDETTITPESVAHFQLLWKLKLDNQSKQLNALTSPIVINPVYTNHGAETYVVVGGSSDNLYVVDADTGKIAWQKHFTNGEPPSKDPQSGTYFCPDALNDTPVIENFGRNGPTVYVISIDGKLHALNLVNGEDRFPPKQFVPAYSKNWSLNVQGHVVYTTTSQGCAHAKSAVWAMDLNSPDQIITSFVSDTYGGGIWGRGGVSIGNDGTVYAATGDGGFDPASGKYADTVLALSPKELKLLNYFTPTNANYLTRKDLDMGNTTPIVFTYKGKEYLAAAGKEGKLFVLDAKSPGGETHRKAVFESPVWTNAQADIAGRGFWGAFASWEDSKGARWLYAPAWGAPTEAASFAVTNGPAQDGSIMAFKMEEKDGSPVLTPAWISHNMAVPEPPVVANGVVFSISSGEFVRQVKENGSLYTGQERIELSKGNATLYAFDAQTGKELFSSGKTMTSFTHMDAVAVSDGRVFVTTHDNTLYAFGVNEQ